MDVDGVLTDGGVCYIDGDREAKRFDVKDGVGLWMARRAGLRTGLITGRSGAMITRRATELKMDEVHMRALDKLAAYRAILGRQRLGDAQVCYIGDDLIDLPILARVGLPVAVADAHPEVERRAPFVTRAPGGRGAVREVIEAILKAQGRWPEVMRWFEPGRAGPRAAHRPAIRRARR
jgi:3-deoxy-D-manno-octulosonate 8-phosphate phosphatase (KDO 8-P phosphatase)